MRVYVLERHVHYDAGDVYGIFVDPEVAKASVTEEITSWECYDEEANSWRADSHPYGGMTFYVYPMEVQGA